MLNVSFSESTKNSLKSLKDTKMSNSTIVCLPDDLSVGNISQVDYENRKDEMISIFGNYDTVDYIKYINTIGKNLYQEFFMELYKHKEITIWYSNSPIEYCGMLYTLYLLKDIYVSVSMVNCSRTIQNEFINKEYKVTMEISPEEYSYFLPYIENINDDKKQDYIKMWKKLAEENGWIRVYEDNSIKTSSISYYDNYILNQISHKHKTVGNVISEVLNKVTSTKKVFISDGMICSRIRMLIQERVIKQEGRSKCFYKNNIIRM